jgi:DNA topoisomerase VI subunit A
MYAIDMAGVLAAVTGLKGWELEHAFDVSGDHYERFRVGSAIAATLKLSREELHLTLEEPGGQAYGEEHFKLSRDPDRMDSRIKAFVKCPSWHF